MRDETPGTPGRTGRRHAERRRQQAQSGSGRVPGPQAQRLVSGKFFPEKGKFFPGEREG